MFYKYRTPLLEETIKKEKYNMNNNSIDFQNLDSSKKNIPSNQKINFSESNADKVIQVNLRNNQGTLP